jgi:uncharacterized lipoprotein YmbA
MMASSVARILLIAFVTAALSGCGATNPSHFYTLDLTASPEGTPDAGITVAVGPVTLPASVDRPQFVVQVAPNQVDIDEYNRWAAPLDDNIARVVAGNLAVLLGTPRVARAPFANFNPTYRVTIDVQRFESVPGKSALIDALWTVRKSADGQTRSGHTLAREVVQGKGFDALAAAHSRALEQVSRDIAAAIRAEQDKKP